MNTLTCSNGCKHEGRWCDDEDCTACVRDGAERCNVAKFARDNFADCQGRFALHDVGHMTGFTRRAFAALVHLGDASTVADPSNRPGVIAAIAAILTCRSMRELPDIARDMIGDDRALADARSMSPGGRRMCEIDGAQVVTVEYVDWRDDDDPPIRQSTVIGRAIVKVAGGEAYHGLTCLPFVPFGELGRPVAVVIEPSTGRFAAIPLPRVKVEPESHGTRRSK
jgi:hypothetical protein